MSYFTELGLAEPILKALGTKGYSDPTPIQHQAIPALLEGRDLLGIAQTGTGKTAAFSLPSLHRLIADPKPRRNASCRMLVLSPTRELAAQIAENIRGYARYLQLNVQCVFGGIPVGKQARALVAGCDVLVATPGRLLDLIDNRALTLRDVEIFVLDEADQMMDLGFIVPLKRIARLLPEKRQSLFFSATMPKAIAELGRQFINDPVRVEVTPQATTAERVEQYSTFVNQKEKQALLTIRLKAALEDGSLDRALVFTRTKHGADRVVRNLVSAGIDAAAIHGNKSQGQRTAALQAFRSGRTPVLVATDIAARGIDVSGVSHVFNFELPNVAEQYVHRIGRTARAGADGVAISFVAADERSYLRDIERLTGVKLAPMPLPEGFQQLADSLPAAAPVQRGPRTQNREGQGQGRGRRPEQRPEPRRTNRGSYDRRDEPRRDSRGNDRGSQRSGYSVDLHPDQRPDQHPGHRADRGDGQRVDQRSDVRRDGRRDHQRSDYQAKPHGGSQHRAKPHDGANDGQQHQQKRHFRPKGASHGVGRHKGAVTRAG